VLADGHREERQTSVVGEHQVEVLPGLGGEAALDLLRPMLSEVADQLRRQRDRPLGSAGRRLLEPRRAVRLDPRYYRPVRNSSTVSWLGSDERPTTTDGGDLGGGHRLRLPLGAAEP
jgi:hypothetical protein